MVFTLFFIAFCQPLGSNKIEIGQNTIVQGIIGCLYSCPDMVGGGALSSASEKYDTELYIRWAEANTYCSMMQFSIAPWCVLGENECDMIRRLADTHTKIGDIIMGLAKNASNTGEPIVRCMEYEFPNQGFETVTIDMHLEKFQKNEMNGNISFF